MTEYINCCVCDCDDENRIKSYSKKITNFLKEYTWIVNAYIADFYTQRHYSHLPLSWWETLQHSEPEELIYLLDNSHWNSKNVWSLSLLAFSKSTKLLSLGNQYLNIKDENYKEIIERLLQKKCTHWKSHDINNHSLINSDISTSTTSSSNCDVINKDRQISTKSKPYDSSDGQIGMQAKHYDRSDGQVSKQAKHDDIINKDGQMMSLDHCYRRHVKPKKQHEISQLAKIIDYVCRHQDVDKVLDLGAGQGHLSRILSYGYQLQVKTVEATDFHAPKAKQFDEEVKNNIHKGKILTRKERKRIPKDDSTSVKPSMPDYEPDHLVGWIDSASTSKYLFKKNGDDGMETRKTEDFSLVGLHACGDLSSTLLRMYVTCPSIKAMISVACCYMKLSTEEEIIQQKNSKQSGYPMSSYIKSLPGHKLTFEAREMACHFVQQYKQKLKDRHHSLTIQSYRAVLQLLIEENAPEYTNGLTKLSLKSTSTMTPEQYFNVAFDKLKIAKKPSDTQIKKAMGLIKEWKGLIGFCTLRLSLAPVVEALLLFDRMMYLQENDFCSILLPVFDDCTSPRNQALISLKRPNKNISQENS